MSRFYFSASENVKVIAFGEIMMQTIKFAFVGNMSQKRRHVNIEMSFTIVIQFKFQYI
jgi:hypothetical protein